MSVKQGCPSGTGHMFPTYSWSSCCLCTQGVQTYTTGQLVLTSVCLASGYHLLMCDRTLAGPGHPPDWLIQGCRGHDRRQAWHLPMPDLRPAKRDFMEKSIVSWQLLPESPPPPVCISTSTVVPMGGQGKLGYKSLSLRLNSRLGHRQVSTENIGQVNGSGMLQQQLILPHQS